MMSKRISPAENPNRLLQLTEESSSRALGPADVPTPSHLKGQLRICMHQEHDDVPSSTTFGERALVTCACHMRLDVCVHL
eukprot:m.706033 g.706033  ORF g.706033 m.706033 type:complete len:80 (-) comp58723_c0_seq94:986-1225(-)